MIVGLNDGRQELIIGVPNEVWGLSPDTGKLLWYAETRLSGNVAPSPVTQDGIVYLMGRYPKQQPVAIRAGGNGDVTKSHILWSTRNGSYIPSPVLCDGNLYWVDDAGFANCIEAMTGKSIYRERLPRAADAKSGKPFYASVVLVKDRIVGGGFELPTFVLILGFQRQQGNV